MSVLYIFLTTWQPRRVAAITVANRVAEEVGCKLGEEVLLPCRSGSYARYLQKPGGILDSV